MITDFRVDHHFVTPIMKCQVNLPHAEIAQYCRDKLQNYGHYTSYFDRDFNEHMKENFPYRLALESCLTAAGKMFADERSIETEPVMDYWFSVYWTGEDHVLHTHPGTVTAGTYYPHGDEKSTKIRFRHPAATLLSHAEPMNDKEVFYTHYPKTGELNCWPSWLEHEVRPQGEVDPAQSRVAISFNYGKSQSARIKS
jgi:uncharacterized protein (TIGR02466 family)